MLCVSVDDDPLVARSAEAPAVSTRSRRVTVVVRRSRRAAADAQQLDLFDWEAA